MTVADHDADTPESDDTEAESTEGDATEAEVTEGDDTGGWLRAGEDIDGKWPVTLRGVTESIVTTRGPNDRWNVAALGLHTAEGQQYASGDKQQTPDSQQQTSDSQQRASGDHQEVTARTWGRTRTWRNFSERGEGYVQFVSDPVVFVDAALSIREEDDPVLAQADAWVRVTVDRLDSGTDGETEWVDWRLRPKAGEVRRQVVPTFNRGYGAVVEATVAASRLDVEAYDTDQLHDRIDYFEQVTQRCGGPAEREAFERLRDVLACSGADDP